MEPNRLFLFSISTHPLIWLTPEKEFPRSRGEGRAETVFHLAETFLARKTLSSRSEFAALLSSLGASSSSPIDITPCLHLLNPLLGVSLDEIFRMHRDSNIYSPILDWWTSIGSPPYPIACHTSLRRELHPLLPHSPCYLLSIANTPKEINALLTPQRILLHPHESSTDFINHDSIFLSNSQQFITLRRDLFHLYPSAASK